MKYEDYIESCYFYEVMEQDDKLVHSGGTGVILIACGVGDTPEESLETPYDICENVIVPDKQYRTDLDVALPKMVKEALKYAAD